MYLIAKITHNSVTGEQDIRAWHHGKRCWAWCVDAIYDGDFVYNNVKSAQRRLRMLGGEDKAYAELNRYGHLLMVSYTVLSRDQFLDRLAEIRAS